MYMEGKKKFKYYDYDCLSKLHDQSIDMIHHHGLKRKIPKFLTK